MRHRNERTARSIVNQSCEAWPRALELTNPGPDLLEVTRSPAAPHAEAVARALNRGIKSDVSEQD